jgi:transcriptional regulator with XRE-family HTH domain
MLAYGMKKVVSQNDLKENIKLMIEKNEATQSALARFVGVDPDTFSGYMTSKTRRINAAWLPKIARFFGVTIDHLYGVEPCSEAGETSSACGNDSANAASA